MHDVFFFCFNQKAAYEMGISDWNSDVCSSDLKYYVEFTAPDGTRVRHSTGTSDRRKAEEYHDRLKAELWEASRLKKKPKRTWDEAALRWLKEKAHKKSRRDDVQRDRTSVV